MRITYAFSRHAASRLRERNLTPEQLDAALNEPATTMPGNAPGKKKYIGRPDSNGRQVVVVASDPPDATGQVTVVTCYLQ